MDVLTQEAIGKLVHSLMRNWSLPEDVRDDVYQAGWLGALHRLQSYDASKHTSMLTWVYPKVREQMLHVLNQWRNRSRRTKRRFVELPEQAISPQAIEARASLAMLARRGLPEHIEVFLEHVVQGAELKEIGARRGLSRSRACRMAQGACMSLRECEERKHRSTSLA